MVTFVLSVKTQNLKALLPLPLDLGLLINIQALLTLPPTPPCVLLQILLDNNTNLSAEEVILLKAAPYREIRSQLLQYFRSLQASDPDVRIAFTTDSFGFFDAMSNTVSIFNIIVKINSLLLFHIIEPINIGIHTSSQTPLLIRQHIKTPHLIRT